MSPNPTGSDRAAIDYLTERMLSAEARIKMLRTGLERMAAPNRRVTPTGWDALDMATFARDLLEHDDEHERDFDRAHGVPSD